jgi:hypothetical protein
VYFFILPSVESGSGNSTLSGFNPLSIAIVGYRTVVLPTKPITVESTNIDFCCVLFKVGHFDFEIFLKKVDIEKKERKKKTYLIQ